MKVILGPTPCHDCGAPVTVVRRPVLITGHAHGCGARWHEPCVSSESTEMTETVVLGADRNAHRCRKLAAA